MTITEFSDQFDVLYNNITSNQAPGLNEYEKSLFLTKAEKEIVKNYFTANSKGNAIGQGFDDSAKRQADFSILMKTDSCTHVEITAANDTRIDPRSRVYKFPDDVFIMVNETATVGGTDIKLVIPLRYDDYTTYMSKPFKRPLKNQVWRLMNSGTMGNDGHSSEKKVELIFGPEVSEDTETTYKVRYVRVPKPIIVGDIDTLKIDGYSYEDLKQDGDIPLCEIDPILHDDILQRAVELAKIAWAGGQEELAQAQLQMTSGLRSE